MNDDVLHDELKQMYEEEPGSARVLYNQALRAPISAMSLKPAMTLGPKDTVRMALDLMAEHHVGCVMVVEGERLVGVFSERDVVLRVVRSGLDPDTTPLAEVMSPDPSVLTPEHMIAYALNFMHVGGFRHVPVVDAQGRPQGLVGVRNVLAYFAEYFPAEVRNLPPPTQDDHMPRHGG